MIIDRTHKESPFKIRYTSFNPPVLSKIDKELVSTKPVRRKKSPEYLEYCRNIQLYGTNLISKEDGSCADEKEEEH